MTIDDGIKSLTTLAEKRGYITYEDVSKTFPDRTLSTEELDEICARLRNIEIEIVDQTDRNDSQI